MFGVVQFLLQWAVSCLDLISGKSGNVSLQEPRYSTVDLYTG